MNPDLRKLLAAADHIEIEHERELSTGTLPELQRLHAQMHRDRDDWNHPTHPLTTRSQP